MGCLTVGGVGSAVVGRYVAVGRGVVTVGETVGLADELEATTDVEDEDDDESGTSGESVASVGVGESADGEP